MVDVKRRDKYCCSDSSRTNDYIISPLMASQSPTWICESIIASACGSSVAQTATKAIAHIYTIVELLVDTLPSSHLVDSYMRAWSDHTTKSPPPTRMYSPIDPIRRQVDNTLYNIVQRNYGKRFDRKMDPIELDYGKDSREVSASA